LDVPEKRIGFITTRIKLFAGEAKDLLNPCREKEREAEEEERIRKTARGEEK